jgi:hypothetical protein
MSSVIRETYKSGYPGRDGNHAKPPYIYHQHWQYTRLTVPQTCIGKVTKTRGKRLQHLRDKPP